MPGDDLAARVLLRFVIEVGIKHYGLTATYWLLRGNVHFVAGHQKGSNAFWIISDYLFTQVILVAAISIWIPAQAGDAYCALEIRLTICISVNESRNETVIASLSNPQIRNRQVTVTNT